MALVLITHDMGVVAETAERVVVQYAGQQVERQSVRDLFRTPRHPYTAAFLSALPDRAQGARLSAIPGVVPGLFDRPDGCLFNPRCSRADDICRTVAPPRQGPDLGEALCHYPVSDTRGGGMNAIVTATDIKRFYKVKKGFFSAPMELKALAGASFSVEAGKTLAVVGRIAAAASPRSRAC